MMPWLMNFSHALASFAVITITESNFASVHSASCSSPSCQVVARNSVVGHIHLASDSFVVGHHFAVSDRRSAFAPAFVRVVPLIHLRPF